MNENEKRIKELLESEDIPEQLSPENIKKLLDDRAAGETPQVTEVTSPETGKNSRKNIAMRTGAIAAAVAVLAGGGALYRSSVLRKDTGEQQSAVVQDESHVNESVTGYGSEVSDDEETAGTDTADTEETVTESVSEAPYMSGAGSYGEIYSLLKRSNESRYQIMKTDEEAAYESSAEAPATGGDVYLSSADADYSYEDNSDDAAVYDEAVPRAEESDMIGEGDSGMGGGDDTSYYDTYNQEEGVLEADIVKTDGKNIYYVGNRFSETGGYTAALNIASADDGTFTSQQMIDISEGLDLNHGEDYTVRVSADDMYLYNGMIAVVGGYDSFHDFWISHSLDEKSDWDEYDSWDWDSSYGTFVSFYTADEDGNISRTGTYYQDGYYNDVRISPDGYMYLVTTYSSDTFFLAENEEDIEDYIPMRGIDGGIECLDCSCVLMPAGELQTPISSYTVIGSLDLTAEGQFSEADCKALLGYTGTVYSSADNLYTAVGWDNTDITRISIGGGNIEPAASGSITGYVLDQFSMSEYGGYFRVAATEESWNEVYTDDTGLIGDIWIDWTGDRIDRHNYVYVLDMDMNIVGSITDFGEDEMIKSVNFQGDTAYVVTYEQTDPLFAIDLSDPTAPAMLDDFQILGYSTYMQKWGDGLLLGFGADADEDGIEHGVKAVMFDNSDPTELQEVGIYSVTAQDENEWIYSPAVYERKALLIAPEKNLFGFPIERHSFGFSDGEYWNASVSGYIFLSYGDGQFNYLGELMEDNVDYYSMNNRAIYIGGYIYICSPSRFTALDMETMNVTDTAYFGFG
ncbi:MAG: beta-propeller domain-containing protein [Ruminococcus sp.]|nr:beta-propeller domain-containing protein [Ruminococcus sp.]